LAKIFLSYTSEEKEYAQKLKYELEKHGHSSWWFDESLPAGSTWQDEIIRSISEMDVIVPLISEKSMKSAWINHEIGAAVAYAQERGRPLIIPIMLGDFDIPVSLQRYQCIYDRDRDVISTAERIVDGINAFLGRKKAEQDERREFQEQVEKSAADFVSKALSDLSKREKSYKFQAYLWYVLSYIALLSSVGFGVWKASNVDLSNATWQAIAQVGVSGVIIIGLMIALAKYSFNLGKSFMVEAIRNADRRHAISFGEFYLKAFGDKSSRDEIRDVFKEWNIDRGSFFINQKADDFDPQLIQIIAEVVKTITGKKSK